MSRRYRSRRSSRRSAINFLVDVIMTFFFDSYDPRKGMYGDNSYYDPTMTETDCFNKRAERAFGHAMEEEVNRQKAVEAHCVELRQEQSKNYTYKTDSSSKMDEL